MIAFFIVAAAVALVETPHPPTARGEKVTLIAPVGSRLANEVALELRVSAFGVVRLALSSDGKTAEGASATKTPVVVIVQDEKRVVIVDQRGESKREREFLVADRGRLGRRRVCISVIEYLRVSDEGDRNTVTEPEHAEVGDDDPSGSSATDASATEIVTRDSAPPHMPRAARIPRWWLGASGGLSVNDDLASPHGYMTFLGVRTLSSRLSVDLRALWPLLGSQGRDRETKIRAWTFGAKAGLQVRWDDAVSWAQPFLGVAAGLRLLMVESDLTDLQSRVKGIPCATLNGVVGVRIPLGAASRLLVELEAGDAVRVTSEPLLVHERDAADASFVSGNVGMVFEY